MARKRIAGPPRFESEGRLVLKERMKRFGISQVGLATVVGAAQPTVCNWLTGATRPDPLMRAALETVYGIPSESWMTDDERAHLEALICIETEVA